MPEIAGPLLFMIAASIAMGLVMLRLTRTWSSRATVMTMAFVVLALLAHSTLLHDNLMWTRLIASPNVIVYSNLALQLSAILVALVWRAFAGPTWQRWMLVLVIGGLGIWRGAGHYLRPRAAIRSPVWSGEVCRQTTLSTCSAAAAVTVLHSCGIETNEGEMARLCITTVDGTPMLGIYRGLVIKTGGTPWRVETVRETSASIRAARRERIVFSLRDNTVLIGGKHSVVLLRFDDNGEAVIGDPFSGMQRWSAKEFDRLWSEEGFALVRR